MWCSIEGGIGAGKTTFIEKVVPKLLNDPIVIIPEPVEEWEKSGILAKSYTDPTYTFPAQCTFFTSRIKAFRQRYNVNALNVSERSPFSDKLFWNIQNNEPLLHTAYMDMWAEWQNLMPVRRPDIFIYLKSSTKTAMDRISERNRSAEDGIEESYLSRLNKEHDLFLLDPLGVLMPNGARVPCMVIDSEENFRDDPSVAQRIATSLQSKLDSF
jgi:deoxyadenosine/deoxycytidine kinase